MKTLAMLFMCFISKLDVGVLVECIDGQTTMCQLNYLFHFKVSHSTIFSVWA